MTLTLLITRPEEDSADTAASIRALGFETLEAPVLEIIDTDHPLPDPAPFDALIVSSANGLRALMRRGHGGGNVGPAWFSKKLFAVGPRTGALARELGWSDVVAGPGRMADLVRLIEAAGLGAGRLLHLHGADMRENPASYLSEAAIESLPLYEAHMLDGLTLPVLRALEEKQIQGILFYSARTAQAFLKAVGNSGLKGDFSGVHALCIAPSVLESLGGVNWAGVHVASTPDQTGMMRLIESLKSTMTQPFADLHSDPDAIPNAELVIELFGGIRPMASKMGIPVTTVQGWKKRNVIPGNRRNDVMHAAAMHGIALDGVRMETQKPSTPEGPSVPRDAQSASMSDAAIARAAIMDEIRRAQGEAEQRAVRKSLMASAALIGVFVVISAALIAVGKQKFQAHDAQLAAIEEQVQYGAPPAPQGPGISAQIGKTISDLREKTEALQGTVQDLKIQFENGTLVQRLGKLEDALSMMTSGNADLSGLMARIDALQSSVQGQDKMQAVVADLQKIVAGLEGRVDGIEPALQEEQESKDSALSEALQGVSPQELKAAAMLIGLSQFRDTMRRSGPFNEDLAMLQAILGDKDPELNAAIERLAPYADQGVLSPNGLSNELRGLTGEIVVSSLKGEDVSVQEKALARFHQVLKIEKDGQPITGNQTQATVAQAQLQLDQGDIEGAIATLETLQGPARSTAQPIIDQAEATRIAQEVQSLLTGSVLKHIENIGKGGTGAIPYTTQRSPVPAHNAPQLNIPGQP